MALYAVFDISTGNGPLAYVDSIDQIDPLQYTYQLVPDGSGEAALPDEEVRWDSGSSQFVVDYTTLEQILKVQIDLLREEAQQTAVTDGFGKAQEYAGKAAEITLYDIMDPAQFAGLSDAQLHDKFSFAYEDAIVFGDTVAAAIERFREGARTSRYLLAKQAALAQLSRTLVTVETTPEAKRLAVANFGIVAGTPPESGGGVPVESDLYLTDENGVALTNEQGIAILV